MSYPAPPRVHRGRTASAVALLAVLAVVLTGCGSSPDFRYVANSDRTIVVKLPASWSEVAAKDVAESATTSKQWLGLYDASTTPTVNHFSQTTPADALSAPLVQIVTFPTTPAQAAGYTDDKLLDIIWPASEKGVQRRKIQAQIAVDPQVQFAEFKASAVTRSTGHGVLAVNAYDFGQGLLGIAKLVMIDKSQTHLHAIQIWCSLDCLVERRAEVDAVLASFTVKTT